MIPSRNDFSTLVFFLMMNAQWQPKAFKNSQWIVKDFEFLGGKLAVRGTRLSVALILSVLPQARSVNEINETFGDTFPPEALPQVLKVASELADQVNIAYSDHISCDFRWWL